MKKKQVLAVIAFCSVLGIGAQVQAIFSEPIMRSMSRLAARSLSQIPAFSSLPSATSITRSFPSALIVAKQRQYCSLPAERINTQEFKSIDRQNFQSSTFSEETEWDFLSPLDTKGKPTYRAILDLTPDEDNNPFLDFETAAQLSYDKASSVQATPAVMKILEDWTTWTQTGGAGASAPKDLDVAAKHATGMLYSPALTYAYFRKTVTLASSEEEKKNAINDVLEKWIRDVSSEDAQKARVSNFVTNGIIEPEVGVLVAKRALEGLATFKIRIAALPQERASRAQSLSPYEAAYQAQNSLTGRMASWWTSVYQPEDSWNNRGTRSTRWLYSLWK